VKVSLRLGRTLPRCEQLVESLRRLDRVEPVALVNGGALHNGPASLAPLQPVEEARTRRHVGEHTGNLLAHQDDDIGLGERAIAREAHDEWKNLMLGTLPRLEAPPAAVDEFAKASAEPGDRNLALRHEGCE